MGEIQRIVEQAEKMFEGGAWHGPGVLESLTGVDATTAAARPIVGAHSIWEVVAHLAATQAVLLRRIGGESAGLQESEFWPEVASASDQAWAELMGRLKRQEAALREAISGFQDKLLDGKLTAEGSSAYNNFHGHIQHLAYHAGQINLLKKAVLAQKS